MWLKNSTEIIKPICIPESFNTNISHQLFVYKITYVNSQHKNTNSKGDFVLKNQFETLVCKYKYDSDFV